MGGRQYGVIGGKTVSGVKGPCLSSRRQEEEGYFTFIHKKNGLILKSHWIVKTIE